ncbi:MAG: trypsin-like peptidase domain-containing protein [Myxococcota bacterium]
MLLRIVAFTLAVLLGACATAPSPTRSQDRSLTSLDRSLRELAERVNPSVVRVHAVRYTATDRGRSTATSLVTRGISVGSGVVVAPGGVVVTNFHVIANAARVWVEVPAPAASRSARQSVVGAPYERVSAEVLGVDAETDLAVLRVARDDLPALPLGNSEAVEPGQLVVAFGSPLGLEGSVTMGVVSATARQLQPESPVVYIQTDTAINPGSSGGPLVDLNGRVMGINTLILSQSGGSEGIGLAMPAHIVETVVQQLRTQGRVRRGVIGVRTQTITPGLAEALGLPQRWGVLVADVAPDGPAAQADLRPGDIIARLDGRPMENARQFQVNVYQRLIGTQVRLELQRGADTIQKEVAVVERLDPPSSIDELADPRSQTLERLGVVGIDLRPTFAARIPRLRERSGVLVVAAAARSGFAVGDVIHAVGRSEVGNFGELQEALGSVSEETPLVIQIERAGVYRYVEVPF